MEKISENRSKKPKNLLYSALPYALFLVGGELIFLGGGLFSRPFSLSFLAVIAFSLLLLWALSEAARSVFRFSFISEVKGIIKKLLFALFCILGIVAAASVLWRSLGEFINFAEDVMLLRSPSWLLVGIFLLFCGYLGSKGAVVIKKFALIGSFTVAFGIILLLIFSFSSIDLTKLSARFSLEFNLSEMVFGFFTSISPLVVPIIFLCGEKKRGGFRRGGAPLGLIIGSVLLLICYFNLIFLLGEGFGGDQKYPYFAMASTISVGKNFMRMEGISYIICLFSLAFRISVCLSTLATLSKKLFFKGADYPCLCYIVSGLVFFVTLLFPI